MVVDETPAAPEWAVEPEDAVDRSAASVPFRGRFGLTERTVAGRPVYAHAEKDYALWFSGQHGIWIVTIKSKVGATIGSEASLVTALAIK